MLLMASLRRIGCAAAMLGATTCGGAIAAQAQAAPPPGAAAAVRVPGDLRDIRIGANATEIPTAGYYKFACGSNGGPPLNPLQDWSEFKKCLVEKGTGLREVYFEYDNEGELAARMLADLLGPENANIPGRNYNGTRVAGYPVVLSVLFDETGSSKAIRAVTDDRAAFDYRHNAYLMRIPIMNQWGGASSWECKNTPLSEGQTPVGSFFVKMHCEKDVNADRHMVVEANLYRKPGQTGFDRAGQPVEGDYLSQSRWENWDVAWWRAHPPTP